MGGDKILNKFSGGLRDLARMQHAVFVGQEFLSIFDDMVENKILAHIRSYAILHALINYPKPGQLQNKMVVFSILFGLPILVINSLCPVHQLTHIPRILQHLVRMVHYSVIFQPDASYRLLHAEKDVRDVHHRVTLPISRVHPLHQFVSAREVAQSVLDFPVFFDT
jgi:hypothetical protein